MNFFLTSLSRVLSLPDSKLLMQIRMPIIVGINSIDIAKYFILSSPFARYFLKIQSIPITHSHAQTHRTAQYDISYLVEVRILSIRRNITSTTPFICSHSLTV